MNSTTGNDDSNSPIEDLLDILRQILKELATEPLKTKIESDTLGFSTTNIVIHPWQGDYGRIYGKGGEHLWAMKTICKLVSDKTGQNINLEMLKIPPGEKTPDLKFEFQEDWDKRRIKAFIVGLFKLIVSCDFEIGIADDKHGKTEIGVVTSEDLAPATAQFIKNRLDPLMKAIGLKNGRHFSFAVIRNDELLNRLRNKNEEPPR